LQARLREIPVHFSLAHDTHLAEIRLIEEDGGLVGLFCAALASWCL
jgi:hypothetical protein